MDADGRHHFGNADRDLSERSPAAALPRPCGQDAGEVRHSDRDDAIGQSGQALDPQGATLAWVQPQWVDVDLDGIPPQIDDYEIVAVGEPIWDVVKVEVIGPLTLAVAFEDGLAGTVRFERSYLRGVFAGLADPAYFGQVGIAHGAVSWPNEMPDLAPDAMHDEIAKHGEWVLG